MGMGKKQEIKWSLKRCGGIWRERRKEEGKEPANRERTEGIRERRQGEAEGTQLESGFQSHFFLNTNSVGSSFLARLANLSQPLATLGTSRPARISAQPAAGPEPGVLEQLRPDPALILRPQPQVPARHPPLRWTLEPEMDFRLQGGEHLLREEPKDAQSLQGETPAPNFFRALSKFS